ncbi:hypothetical protein KHA80_00845 [Anaerobacillus sp. HL2]|nr:hypothetical protein KHA80_00845 [Anaerobacillus sp. HL2]
MGADRDSGILNSMGYFDERSPSVKRAIEMLIEGAHRKNEYRFVDKVHHFIQSLQNSLLMQELIASVLTLTQLVKPRRLIASVEQNYLK